MEPHFQTWNRYGNRAKDALEDQPILPNEFSVKIDGSNQSTTPPVPINATNSFNQTKAQNPPVPMNPMQATSSFNSKEFRVSFKSSNMDPPSIAKLSTSSSKYEDEEEKETKECMPESPFRTAESFQSRGASLLRRKTRSRLMDPPPPVIATTCEIERKSSRLPFRSNQVKSGAIGMSGSIEDEEDESFLDEDIPNEFKRSNFDFLTILQCVSLISILAALLCTVALLDLRRRTLWGLELWKWELLVFVLVCGRLVSGWVIRIAVFFIERNFLLRKRVLYFVYALRRAVQNNVWLGLVLLSWLLLLDDNRTGHHPKTLPYVTKVLLCLLVATLFHLVKTLLVKLLASSFHFSTYFDRIQEALFHQYVIETLSGPPVIEIQKAKDEEEQLIADMHKFQNMGYKIPRELHDAALAGGKIKADSWKKKEEEGGAKGTMSVEQLYKLSQRNVSAWNMKRLIRTVRYGTLTTLDEQIPSATRCCEDESTTQIIRSEHEAKAAAKKIFVNVAKPGAK